jgi:hypothetical protein
MIHLASAHFKPNQGCDWTCLPLARVTAHTASPVCWHIRRRLVRGLLPQQRRQGGIDSHRRWCGRSRRQLPTGRTSSSRWPRWSRASSRTPSSMCYLAHGHCRRPGRCHWHQCSPQRHVQLLCSRRRCRVLASPPRRRGSIPTHLYGRGSARRPHHLHAQLFHVLYSGLLSVLFESAVKLFVHQDQERGGG